MNVWASVWPRRRDSYVGSSPAEELAACAHKMQTGSKLKFRQPPPHPPFARLATTPRVSVRSAILRSVAVLVTRCNQPPPTIMKSINPEESGLRQRAHQPFPRTFFPSSSSFSLSLSSYSSSSPSSFRTLHQCSFSFFVVLEMECCSFAFRLLALFSFDFFLRCKLQCCVHTVFIPQV